MSKLTDGPWMASDPHPQTNACTIVNPQGRVVAAIVPNKDDADFICEARAELAAARKVIAEIYNVADAPGEDIRATINAYLEKDHDDAR